MDKKMSRALGNYYDQVAAMYDGNKGGKWGTEWTVNDSIADALAELRPQVSSYLDLGAGTGQTIAAASPYISPQKIVAVDVSAKMLALAKQKYPHIQTECDDIESYVRRATTRRQAFELVTAMGVVEFLPDLPRFLGDVGQLLTSGGYLLMSYELGDAPQEVFHSQAIEGAALTFYHWEPQAVEGALHQWGAILSEKDIPAYSRHGRQLQFRFLVVQKR